MNKNRYKQIAIMAANWDTLLKKLNLVSDFSNQIQIDVMDGILSTSISFPYTDNKGFSKNNLPNTDSVDYEVHLMVADPLMVGLQFIELGVESIVAQIEGFKDYKDIENVLKEWKTIGDVKIGLSIMLDTEIDKIKKIIDSDLLDYVQVMSIARIGYQGEKFDERTINRVKELRSKYPNLTISVDGGVGEENILRLKEAGVNIFSVGSTIVNSDNPENSYKKLNKLIK